MGWIEHASQDTCINHSGLISVDALAIGGIVMTTTSSLEDLMADQTQLIPVPPMPDEDIAGYAGRVVNVHGAYTLKDLYDGTPRYPACRRMPATSVLAVDD